MRILFLTQWFQPESVFKGLPFAKALRDKGHHVTVITGYPNYPGGKIYPGYRIRICHKEVMCGIPVHRVPLYPSHNKSTFQRTSNYLSFSLSAAALAPFSAGRPDVIYVYNLVTLWPAATLLRKLFKCSIVYDITDLWPDSVVSSKMLTKSFLLNILAKYCLMVYHRASHIVTTTPGMRKELLNRGIPNDHISVIYNWCNESSLKSVPCSVIKKMPEKFTVVFAGTMGTVQGLDTVLDCAELCRHSLPGVHFVLIGRGVHRLRLQKRALEMELGNVTFLPPRPMETMGEIYALADALLVHLKDDPLFRITIPSKTQAYLYIGKPILMAMRGDAADLVREAGAGVVCDPDDPEQMKKAIDILLEMTDAERKKLGDAGHRYYMEHLSFNQGVNQFERILTSLGKRPA